MVLTRQQFISLTAQAAASWVVIEALAPIPLAAQTLKEANPTPSDQAQRISRLIQAYDRQGIHRTGTEADERSAHWLAEQARQCGGVAELEQFTLSRVDPQLSYVQIGDRRIAGVPLFDGGFTTAEGVRGRLGLIGSDAEIGMVEAPPNADAAQSREYYEARRDGRHRALLVVTRGSRPGLCLINAPNFTQPFGPPVLQVSSEEGEWLKVQANQKREIFLVAHVKRTAVRAFNVTAQVRGADAKLPPLVVMTPRSGWWHCASERGGGIACWLEVMRAVSAARAARPVFFIASSGHELGHLGLDAFLERRPGLVKSAHAWLHFGANIGAAQEGTNRLQASDDEIEKLAVEAMTGAGLSVNDQAKRGSVPLGEAGNIHRGGGRYVSLLGRNALFHHPADRWPEAVDVAAIARYATAFSQVALKL